MAAQSITSILGKAEAAGTMQAGEKRIPYHRIVYADGKIWVNPKYRKERLALYKKEGIEIDKNDRIKNFGDIVFEFE